MGRHYLQGLYKPRNPSKYVGDLNKIVYRSSFEYVAFKFCDTNKAVLKWNSEEVVIPYICPDTGKRRRYFMDLQIWTVNKNTGAVQVTLVEVKPEAQTKPPKRGRKKEATYLREVATWRKNDAKWKATQAYCDARGWAFVKWTEKQLVVGHENDGDLKRKMAMHRKDVKQRNSQQEKRKRRVAKMVQAIKQSKNS